MINKKILLLFPVVCLLIICFLIPQKTQALEFHRPSPLSSIHNQIFSGQKGLKGNYQYYFIKDLYPKKPKQAIRRSDGDVFSFNIPSSKILKIHCQPGGNNAIGEQPDFLTISNSQGEEQQVRLTNSEYYFTDLEIGKYLFQLNTTQNNSYFFDFDLADYKLKGTVAYITDLFPKKDLDKVDKFISAPNPIRNRILITTNHNLINQLGVRLSKKKISEQNKEDLLKDLIPIQENVRVFSYKKEAWQPVFSARVGDLIIAGRSSVQPTTTVILISPDLTLLNKNSFKPGSQAISDFFQQETEQKALAYSIVLIIIVSLLITFSVGTKKFTNTFFCQSKNILQLILRKLDDLFVIRFGLKIYKFLFVVLYLLSVFCLYCYSFDIFIPFQKYFFLIIFIIVIWLFWLLCRAEGFNYKSFDNLVVNRFLILIIAFVPLLLLLFATEPIWHFGDWKRSFRFEIIDDQVKTSAGLQLNSNPSKLKISQGYLNTNKLLNFSIKPGLLVKNPDQVNFSPEIESQDPVYLEVFKDDKIEEYLLYYPDFDNYQSIYSQADLSVYSKNDIQTANSHDSIENYLNSLPKNLSLELSTYFKKRTGNLEQEKSRLIDLSQLYRQDIVINGRLMKTVEPRITINNFSFFSYFQDKIKFTIRVKDLNKKMGADDAYIAIYGPDDKLVKTIKLSDDGKLLGEEGESKSYNYSSKINQSGVYNFIVYDYSNSDFLIEKIKLNSPYLSLEREMGGDDIFEIYQPDNFFLPRDDSPLVSFNQGDYFQPYNREINLPGSESDLLIYAPVSKFKSGRIKERGYLHFFLTKDPGRSFRIKSLKIDYLYE